LMLAVALAVPALAQSKPEMQKLNDKWAEAFNKGDAAAVAAMYTEDAICCRRAPR
jgi:ketosteroid isomerase-like protein